MIVSVSRRTDVPAFYSDWFYNRIEEGYLYVINPMNRKQISEIRFNQETVDCFVFWTKNPKPMMDKLYLLDEKGFPYYFQFTLNPYKKDIESQFEDKNELIKTFRTLSHTIGKDKVVWRYDPILLSHKYSKEYHFEWFEKSCQSLANYTELCVISFLDFYSKTTRNTKHLDLIEFQEEDMLEIGERLANIAKQYGIKLQTCSEHIDLSQFGIEKGKCIDNQLISQILKLSLDVKKDDTQREVCGCVKSVDIGQYNTCKHLCAYCYANFSHIQVEDNYKKHDITSPLIIGKQIGDEKVTVRDMKSVVSKLECEQMAFEFE